MQTATHASLRSFAAVLAALSMAVVGSTLTTTPAEAQDQAEPFFAVSPVEPADHMWGQEWLPGSTVRVDIDDPAVAGGVDFTTTLPTDDNGRFEVFDLPFDIQPGQLVTVVQNQEYVKTHEVIDVTIDEVDVVADTVSGTAAAETVTVVVVFPEFSVQVTSDGAGAWAADLGAEGFDLRPGQTVYVYQADEDGDQSQIDRYLPVPYFAVSPVEPADHMWGQEWLPGSTVRVDIDDPAVAGGVDFTTTLPTDDNGRFEVFDLPFDIQPGQLVTVVQNEEYVKTHEVIDVTIDEVDVVADTVSGTAAADTVTVVVVFPEFSVQVTSDGAGAWAADLGAEGFDLRPGQTVYVYQADEDGDQSQIDRYLPEGERLVFRGFADPVDNDVTNLATAGRAVPLKFRVTRGDDVPVTDISNVSVTVTDLQCELGMTADLVEEYAAGKSGLQNLGDGHYQYNWKTSKSYKNSCKLLTLDIGDGVAHTAEFDFVR